MAIPNAFSAFINACLSFFRLISFQEFKAFEAVLCQPDALYRAAFQLFDTNGSGTITYPEFEEIIKLTTLHKQIPFNFSSDFVRLHFGENHQRTINFIEFSQVLNDFHEEHAVQAFKSRDKSKQGVISAMDFSEIMSSCKSHLLSETVKQNLVAIAGAGTGGHQVTFPFFIAFNTLLSNMELVKRIYLSFTKGNTHLEMTKEEFLYSSQQMSQITPLEVDILFQLANTIRQSTGRVSYQDLELIAPYNPTKFLNKPIAEVKKTEPSGDRGVGIQLLESVYRFALGSVAGAAGATVVYPIDLVSFHSRTFKRKLTNRVFLKVKTRMQNQRTGSIVGELMYRNSFDCAKKVIRHEGVFGFYRGLLPQLVGVCPEKAIKLTMNDLVRDKLTSEKGEITVLSEFIAGGCVSIFVLSVLSDYRTLCSLAGWCFAGDVHQSLGDCQDSVAGGRRDNFGTESQCPGCHQRTRPSRTLQGKQLVLFAICC